LVESYAIVTWVKSSRKEIKALEND